MDMLDLGAWVYAYMCMVGCNVCVWFRVHGCGCMCVCVCVGVCVLGKLGGKCGWICLI